MTFFKNKQEFYDKYNGEIGSLRTKFEGYPLTVTKQRIKNYLCQYDLIDKPIGLKLLQKIDYYSNERITNLTKQLGGILKKKTNNKFENVYFCPIDVSSGSSTDTIIRKLRNSMGMDSEKYNDKFIHVSDLENFALDPENQISTIREKINHIESLPNDDISELERDAQINDLYSQIHLLEIEIIPLQPKTIIFIDDYIGSGNSFKSFWSRIGTYYNENNNYILAPLIAHQQGIKSIKSDIPIKIISPTKPIPITSKIFHNKNNTFTKNEKLIIKKYCDKMGYTLQNRYGFMDTQSMVVIYERSSNNVLPILYDTKNNWTPLFPRKI